ncbi:hypothetical protein [Algoriphagus boritolerans]
MEIFIENTLLPVGVIAVGWIVFFSYDLKRAKGAACLCELDRT